MNDRLDALIGDINLYGRQALIDALVDYARAEDHKGRVGFSDTMRRFGIRGLGYASDTQLSALGGVLGKVNAA